MEWIFDDNVSCHFALGSSYAKTILVVGPKLSITGYKKDDTAVPILKNGEWGIVP